MTAFLFDSLAGLTEFGALKSGFVFPAQGLDQIRPLGLSALVDPLLKTWIPGAGDSGFDRVREAAEARGRALSEPLREAGL